ncbi:metal ABC transporter ATP-binding protein [Candidatus Saccharibacteria bacterium]|nr:metal ABC transporter ATP-binding protein [Candidatus Saccharibacteria bacterium]
MADILIVKNLTLGYGSSIILKDVNFKIGDGDFACIVGANGSGKSTLVKGILGLLEPKNGEIIFQNGLQQTTIGYLPQDTHTDPAFPAKVQEIVLSGTLSQLKGPFYSQKEHTKAATSLKRLNITTLKNEPFSSLSGGQKQKVLLARALSATSKLLILDEPSNNLDHQSKKDFYQTLKQLNKDGLTIIMITHDLDAEDLIGNKVIALDSGHVQLATTKTYLKGYQR